MKKSLKNLFLLALAALLVWSFALPALAEETYPELVVTINDRTAPVCPPDKTATVSVSGGSGSYAYQWYYANAIRGDGTVVSPTKGKALQGETELGFCGTATARTAGKYLYCRVTDAVTGQKAYSAGRKLLLLPPMGDGTPQAASIAYDTLTITLPDTYPASHPYHVDSYGAAAVKTKKAAIGDMAARSVRYDKKTNTLTLVFGADLSKVAQPFQVRISPTKYTELTLSISGVTPTKETVTLSKTAASLVIGNTLTLTAKPSAAAWESSNPAVATVNSTGRVTAVGSGTTTITVTSKKGGMATCTVTVAETLKPAPIGGGGSVTIQLQTGSKATCYKLYRAGSTQGMPVRLVYLEPNTSGSMSFDPGTYVLKIASGKTWLGDDQAFGKSGSYSRSDAYDFTPGIYEITTSTTHGDFQSSSMSGFVG